MTHTIPSKHTRRATVPHTELSVKAVDFNRSKRGRARTDYALARPQRMG